MAKEFIIKKSETRDEFISNSTALQFELMEMAKNADAKVVISRKQRTRKQNAALHLDFDNVAKICRENNITADMLFAMGHAMMEVDADIMKSFWHGVLGNMNLEKKTSKLDTSQITEIREGIARAFIIRFGVDIGEFPSIEGLMLEHQINNL